LDGREDTLIRILIQRLSLSIPHHLSMRLPCAVFYPSAHHYEHSIKMRLPCAEMLFAPRRWHDVVVMEVIMLGNSACDPISGTLNHK